MLIYLQMIPFSSRFFLNPLILNLSNAFYFTNIQFPMKNYYILVLLLCTGFTSIQLLAGNKTGKILMYARLSGANEVPAVATQGKGLVTFMLEEDYKTMSIYGVFDSLSGPVTACHFHTGVIGVSGPVTLNLGNLIKGNRIEGKITVPKALLAAIFNLNVYINVHTAANPSGEIRGQVLTETDLHFAGQLLGDNEVPAVNTTGVGLGSFVLNYNATKLDYKVLAAGLSGPITAAHFHYGVPGVSGPVAIPLAFTGNSTSGTVDITPAFRDSLLAGKVYINVHTAAHPAGEIRAQLTFNSFVTFDVDASAANEVPAKTSPGDALAIGWMNGTLDTLSYIAMYDSLTPTLGHFHAGAAGANGPVVIPFTLNANAPFITGRAAIQPDTLAKILKGDIYLNLHTAANPAGELRGQTNTSVREGMIANLCSQQEVPVNTSPAFGAGLLSIDRNKTMGHAEVVVNGLTGNATAGHIHTGSKGVSGPVVINLNINGANANQTSGVFNIARTSLADTLINGFAYFNVHTAANPGGEIRGQIGKDLEPECSATVGTGIDDIGGESLQVKVYPNPMYDVVNLAFESPQTIEAQVVLADMLGRVIAVQPTAIVSGANQISMPVYNLPKGIYILQILNHNAVYFAQKVVKD